MKMPYVAPERRPGLDGSIEELRYAIVKQIPAAARDYKSFELTPEQVLEVSGDLNYCLTSICASFIDSPTSYAKIAIVTGVLDNARLELYRRLAISYEDKKIIENGDISEFIRIMRYFNPSPMIGKKSFSKRLIDKIVSIIKF
jgi:hypothetical protein